MQSPDKTQPGVLLTHLGNCCAYYLVYT
nr:unnamed protein product [Callosobruchus chinensis]